MNYDEFHNSINDIEREIVNFLQGLAEGLTRTYGSANVNILEIGSGWGIFARPILEFCKGCQYTTIDKIPNLEKFDLHTKGFEHQITRLHGSSANILPGLEKSKYHLIYVDGSHSYNDVYNDLNLALPLLKKRGTILMDDVLHKNNFHGDYGVIEALGRFLKEKKLTAELLPTGNGMAIVCPHD